MRRQIEYNNKSAELFAMQIELTKLKISQIKSTLYITHMPTTMPTEMPVIDLGKGNVDISSIDMLKYAIDSGELDLH